MGMKFENPPKAKHNKESKKKIASRRCTKFFMAKAPTPPATVKKKEVQTFVPTPKWWSKASIQYAFSHPHVTSRLEKLMGSNLVCLTDRDYMQKLQERILEDYAESMDKRIKVREHEEMERVKNLVLSGRIPLNEAPESMAEHPIMMIERHCKRLIAQRRAKIKIPKIHIPTHLYSDDTPDPPSGLSIEHGHVFRTHEEKLCNPASRFLSDEKQQLYASQLDMDEDEVSEEPSVTEESKGDVQVEEEEGVVEEFMLSRADYDKLKYESPLIKQLRQCQTVEELYALADEIIGLLKSLDAETVHVRTTSEDTLFSVAATLPSAGHAPEGSPSTQGSVSSAMSR